MEIFEKYILIIGVIAVFAIAYFVILWFFLKKQEFWVKIVAIIVASPLFSFLSKFITHPDSTGLAVKKGIPLDFFYPNVQSINKAVTSLFKNADVNTSGMDWERFFWNTIVYAIILLVLTMAVKAKKSTKK